MFKAVAAAATSSLLSSTGTTTCAFSDTMSSFKTIKEICRKPPSHWVGDGFKVFPVFANKAFTKELSPFLMFDYAAPKHFEPNNNPNKRRGVGQHPHRGFETVTIAFQGEVEHSDSQGNNGVIGPGDVQWMTAAKGIVHEEFHSTEFSKEGGIFEMCQLWVNLPKESKMSKPRYQPILKEDIPKVELMYVKPSDTSTSEATDSNTCTGTVEKAPLDDGHVNIIAGKYQQVKGAAETFTPINMWDVSIMNTKRVYELELGEGHNTLVFVRRGSVTVGSSSTSKDNATLNLADVAIMNQSGTKLRLQAQDKDTAVLILSGEPIDEPIAARGPFVMNTQKELYEAMEDYHYGRNGFEGVH